MPDEIACLGTRSSYPRDISCIRYTHNTTKELEMKPNTICSCSRPPLHIELGYHIQHPSSKTKTQEERLGRSRVDGLEGIVEPAEGIPIPIPLRVGRAYKVGVELVPGARNRDQAVGPDPVDLVGVVELPLVVPPLLRTHRVGAGNLVLEVDVGEGQVGEDGVDGGEGGEPGEEGEVHALGALLGVVELAVGAVGALLHFGDEPLLPTVRDLVDILRRVLLALVAAVATIVGGTGGGAVVEVEGRGVGEGRGGGGEEE